MPIEFRVTYNENKSSVQLRFVKLFNLQVEIIKFIRLLLTTKKEREKITLESILYNLTIFIKSKHIIRTACRLSYVRKVSVVIHEDYDFPFLVIGTWTIVDKFKSFLKSNFFKVYDEYYMVLDNEERKIKFEIIIQMRIILALIAIIINIKDLFKVIKFMRVYYGKSNI